MNYKPRLDGLRCIAILMVLLGHFLYFVGGEYSGVYGVNLFFVLSGFLITSILLSERGKNFSDSYRKFIGRRVLRIFPLYYLIVLFLICLKVEGITQDWPYLATYTYNFKVSGIQDWEHHLYAPYWSLSVEEQFYLFFPFVVLLLNRFPKVQLFVFFFIVIIAFIERIFNFTHIHHYVNLITNMGALTIGAIGAWFTKNNELNNSFFKSGLIEIAMLILLIISFNLSSGIITFFVFPLVNIYLVIKSTSFSFYISPLEKFLASKPAIFIGRISYGIYVYHIIVMHYFDLLIFKPIWNNISFEKLGYFSKLQYNETLIKFPFILLLTIFVAYLSFKFIESPFLKLKDIYFKSSYKKKDQLSKA